MDDEEGRKERLQQAIRELTSMDGLKRKEWIQHCEREVVNGRNDGYSVEFYQRYLEAAKHV